MPPVTYPRRNSKTRKPRADQAQVMRKKLYQKLPAMLDAAIAAYQRIALAEQTDDPKSAAATHTSAKAILGHIDHLIRFTEQNVDAMGVSAAKRSSPGDDMDALLTMARTAIAQEDGPEGAETSTPPVCHE